MKLVIQLLTTYLFVFLIDWYWAEQNLLLKVIVVGIACGGIYHITEKTFEKKK